MLYLTALNDNERATHWKWSVGRTCCCASSLTILNVLKHEHAVVSMTFIEYIRKEFGEGVYRLSNWK
ncbi:hypothetical protein PsorP6_008239 [Peronosclerospora sorghi]|uniref:Uncharacterized protein n=1 Tax=Peronosclerospora sorghi TaxID=230839 RepID=A0ACC0W7L2_9STRA|nr:hypothetical protein PsorP6_008239 [Peronosclerospora sorghi]